VAIISAQTLARTPPAAPHDPAPDPRAVVLCPHASGSAARFTVLTDRLIRMEWSPDGRFEDRASQAFINRLLPVPEFRVNRDGPRTTIDTGAARLSFSSDGKAFHRANLRADFDLNGTRRTWKPGDVDRANLGGTTRTLDGVDGACPIEPGLLSRDGWVVIDDSYRLVFNPAASGGDGPRSWDWLAARGAPPGRLDWYLFAYGHDYAGALLDFTKVAGRIPMPPRYVFGSWWSRYWAYTDAELRELIGEFRHHDVPVDVLVIDMDWHLDGWTGYTWNREFFPQPQEFLTWARSEGLMISLNLHPADGVGMHEDAFEDMARAMRLDPAKTKAVPFDCTDPVFVDAYFRHLHWPLEKQGIDFWWMDWQQGTETKIEGLDPLWWLNHLHWEDLRERQDPKRDPTGIRSGKRPLVFSRWGGLGNHRYPIGFSGDTFSTWASLAFQPPFTATAGNVGYAYWSHDIGGHQPGPVEPELYARWIQYGVLSPILRTHTSKNPLGERRIWASSAREFRAMREAFLFRYALLPYIYTAARVTYDTALPMCRPLYYEWPDEREAYERPGEYLFGDDLLAAPVTARADHTSRASPWSVWLPPGTAWTNWSTGEAHAGGAESFSLVPIDEIPIFARAGAIIPMAPKMRHSREKPLDPLILRVFPGDTGATRVYEDDGDTGGYERGRCAWTPVSFKRSGDTLTVSIGPAEGEFDGMLSERSYEVRLVDRWPARGATLNKGDSEIEYDRDDLAIVVRTGRRSVRERLDIEITLSERDESLLRKGLRGRVRMLRAIAEHLGEHCPEAIASVDALFGASMPDDEFAAALEKAITVSNTDLARAVASCGAPDDAKNEALCCLLGVSCTLAFESHPERDGEVVVTARATLPPGADITLADPTGWRRAHDSRATDGPFQVLTAHFTAPRPLQQTTIRAEVTVPVAGAAPIILPFAETVLPSINGWWVIGPFDEPWSEAQIDRVFPPETDPDPRAAHTGTRGETLRWKRIERVLRAGDDPEREFFVDLHEAFGERRDHAVAYAVTFIESDRDTEALLSIGSDDGVVAWVNGKEVHRHQVMRGYGSKQDRVPVTLKKGRNTLLLKITQALGGWGFGAHVESRDGSPLPGVRVSLSP